MAGAIQPYRPVTSLDRVNAIDALVDAVRPIFNDVYDRAGNYPEFIRSDEPRSPIFAAARDVARFNCRNWAASPKGEYTTRVNMGNSELCEPYLDSLGEFPSPGEVDFPFTGGQCPVVYTVTFNGLLYPFSDCSPVENGLASVGLQGPLLGTALRTISPSGPLCTPGGNTVVMRHGNPVMETPLLGAGYGASITSLSVAREDGLPDNCGNPGLEIRPPATVAPVTPIPPSITVNLPGIGPVEVEIELNGDGDPIICIPIMGVCEQIRVGPPDGVDGDGGDGGGSGPPPGDVGEPGLPDGTGEGGESEGEAPPGSVLVGLRLNLTTAPEKPKEYVSGIYRGAAYIYMGTAQGLDQDYAGSMLTDGQFVFAEKDNLTHWRVRANTGYNWLVIPYYRQVEE